VQRCAAICSSTVSSATRSMAASTAALGALGRVWALAPEAASYSTATGPRSDAIYTSSAEASARCQVGGFTRICSKRSRPVVDHHGKTGLQSRLKVPHRVQITKRLCAGHGTRRLQLGHHHQRSAARE
jgi:hypothetical protein